jgi:beta-glucosidase
VDRAVLRVLAQKESLGLLDETFDAPPQSIDLDSPAHRALARRIAEESIVLLRNDAGTLPLRAGTARIAVVGPNADSSEALMGCYSFVNHVLAHHPDHEAGLALPTLLEALRDEFPEAAISHDRGCDVEGDDRTGFAAAVSAAADADVVIAVVGDRAGLFGRGTVGEGNDVESLELPGLQRELVESLAATGTPLVLVVMSGRPYAIDWALEGPTAASAVLQSFFPGEEGGPAIAAILSGRVSPSGRLPVSMPRSAGAQPYSYLHPILGGSNAITDADSTPLLPFGHGLTYTSFDHIAIAAPAEVAAGDTFEVTIEVRNSGARAGTDVVQLYARDLVGSVTRPVAQLLGYARVTLEPDEEVIVHFQVPTARLAFSGRDLVRIVEPGDVEVWVGPSCAQRDAEATVRLTGPVHVVTPDDPRTVSVSIDQVSVVDVAG